jgi:GT2 family glycosyltransferase
MYLEDTELCSRFIRKGFELIYLPAAVIRHKVTEGGITPLLLYFSIRNRFLFLTVAPSWFPRIVGFAYLSIVTAAKFIYWSVTRKDLSVSVMLAVKDYFNGTFVEGHGLILHEKHGEG